MYPHFQKAPSSLTKKASQCGQKAKTDRKRLFNGMFHYDNLGISWSIIVKKNVLSLLLLARLIKTHNACAFTQTVLSLLNKFSMAKSVTTSRSLLCILVLKNKKRCNVTNHCTDLQFLNICCQKILQQRKLNALIQHLFTEIMYKIIDGIAQATFSAMARKCNTCNICICYLVTNGASHNPPKNVKDTNSGHFSYTTLREHKVFKCSVAFISVLMQSSVDFCRIRVHSPWLIKAGSV